jgi:hypothetical protein
MQLTVGAALVVAAVIVPIWYWDRGLIEIEALEFIQQYLDDRNVVQKVFDPYANDLDTYQARELSYFLDYLDAQVFKLLIAQGLVLLVPASSIVVLVLTTTVFLRSAARYRALPVLTRLLLLLVYYTNYIHLVTVGMFYRSSKPMLAPLLMAAAFYVLRLVREDGTVEGERGWRAPLVIFALFCAMSLLDRQGFFYSMLGLMILVCHALLAQGRRDVAMAAGIAVVAMTAYNVAIAPAIVHLVNGYRPSLEFQRIPVVDLATEPSYYTRAGELLVETSARLLGDVPPAAALAAFVVLAAAAIWKWRTVTDSTGASPNLVAVSRRWTGRSAAAVWALIGLAHIVMYAVMIARFPPLWEHYDHRLWYYPLPFQAFLLTVLVVGLSFVASGWTRTQIAVLNAVLVVVVVANVFRWDDNVRLQRQSRWFTTVHTESYVLKRSLNDGRAYSTHAGYLPFYWYCLKLSPPLRARAEE